MNYYSTAPFFCQYNVLILEIYKISLQKKQGTLGALLFIFLLFLAWNHPCKMICLQIGQNTNE